MNLEPDTTGVTECRLMRAWEELPAGLTHSVVAVDWQWTWVAVRDGAIVAGLFAGPYQGAVFLGTMEALPGAGKNWMRGLLRAAATDCWNRGYRGFLTFLDEGPICRKLRRLMGKSIVHVEGFKGQVVSGLIDRFI